MYYTVTTMWRVRVTIVETQQLIPWVLLSYMSLSAIQNYRVLHNNVLWLIHVARKN